MLAALAAPFPDEAVSTRAEISCDPCRMGGCMTHRREHCATCGETLTTAHVHLEYVGLAWIRERLNTVDPDWNWRPAARTPEGLPLLQDGSLWIELAIGGKTMLGVGDALGLRGANRRKGAVSNALRNAAQGFGVGLYLAKRQPDPVDAPPADDPAGVDDTTTSVDGTEQANPEPAPVEETPDEPSELRARIREFDRRHGRRTAGQTAFAFNKWSNGKQFLRASTAELAEYLDHLLHGPTS